MGKTIVVGNSLTLQGSGLGAEIDRHDTVVRINAYRTRGHEADVGSRVNVWVLGLWPTMVENIEEIPRVPVWAWAGGGPVIHRRGWKEFLDKANPSPWQIQRHNWDTLGMGIYQDLHACGIAETENLWPSTGLVAVLLVRKLLGLNHSSIVGFGPRDRQEDGHYYDAREGVFGRMHNWEAERHYLNRLETEGVLRRLDG